MLGMKTNQRLDQNNLKSTLRRELRLELLEERRVFDAEPVFYFSPGTVSMAEQQALAVYQSNKSIWNAVPQDFTLEKFDSEADAREQLAKLAADYWDEIFGETLKPDRWATQVPQTWFFGSEGSVFTTDRAISSASFDSLEVVNSLRSSSSLTNEMQVGLTNAQIAGVDEHDVVEVSSDGFLFVSQNSRIQIYNTKNSSGPKLVSTIAQDDFVNGLYVVGNRLTSISGNSVSVYDVANKEAPKFVSSFKVGSWIHSSRLVDGSLILVTQDAIQLPQPKLMSNIQGGQATPNSLGRFESREEYLARISPTIVASFLPSVSVGTEFEAAGTWEDLITGNGGMFQRAVSIIAIDIDAETPKLLDTERIIGVSADTIYVDNDSVYLVDGTNARMNREAASVVFRTSIEDGGVDVVADAYGNFRGTVRNSRMMDEFENDLRLITEYQKWDGTRSTNVIVLREDDGVLEQIGSLRDIADGQAALAAYFDGDRAIVTTGEIQDFQFFGFDPLHGIDLSDPTKPQELSDLVIPGFTTHLQWVDGDHFIGVGHIEETPGDWRRQITLYDVSDLAKPVVQANWKSDYSIVPESPFNMLDPLTVSFDQDTGTLVFAERSVRGLNPWLMPFRPMDQSTIFISTPIWIDPWVVPNQPQEPGVQVFTVDSESSTSSLVRQESITLGERARRGFVLDGKVIAIGETKVVSRPLNQPTPNQTDEEEEEQGDYDQNNAPGFSDAKASLSLVAKDSSGALVTSAAVGDKLWIEVRADNLEQNDKGVFQALVDIQFDPASIKIVGQPEALGGFENSFSPTMTDNGISRLGGFNKSLPTIGPGPNSVARFQIEILKTGTVSISVSPTSTTSEAVLVYGDNGKLRRENISSQNLSLIVESEEETSEESTPNTDVNADGNTTAQDALQVINHLNEHSNGPITSKSINRNLDVNGDGFISPVDALLVIQAVNEETLARAAKNSRLATPAGESSLSKPDFVTHDAVMAAFDVDDVQRRRR